MLLISRKIGESLVVYHGGERLVIRFGDTGDNAKSRHRIAIDGPQSFVVVRAEIEGGDAGRSRQGQDANRQEASDARTASPESL